MIFLQREFMAAVCMSLLTTLFAVNVSDLSEEAGLLPRLLICFMAGVNVLQYVLALYRRGGRNLLDALKAYPFPLVLKLFALTLAYIAVLLPLGFYAASFLYFWAGSLLANPTPLNGRIVTQRALGCALFVGGLWLLFSWGLGVLIPLGEIWP